MPFIELKTNVNIGEITKNNISQVLGDKITLLGKSENWLMINISANQSMYFKGNQNPCLMLEVKVYGSVNETEAEEFTIEVTEELRNLTNIPSSRIYISYFGTDTWGYNGNNF